MKFLQINLLIIIQGEIDGNNLIKNVLKKKKQISSALYVVLFRPFVKRWDWAPVTEKLTWIFTGNYANMRHWGALIPIKTEPGKEKWLIALLHMIYICYCFAKSPCCARLYWTYAPKLPTLFSYLINCLLAGLVPETQAQQGSRMGSRDQINLQFSHKITLIVLEWTIPCTFL